MPSPPWLHLQVHQEPTCPPRLQEETWWTGRVLPRFLMMDLDETFREALYGCPLHPDSISRSIRNLPVLQDSMKRLGGWVESWKGSWCWILMKFSVKICMDVLSNLTPSPSLSGPYLSSKSPWRGWEDRESLDKAPEVGSWWNFQKVLLGIFLASWLHLHQEHPHPPRL